MKRKTIRRIWTSILIIMILSLIVAIEELSYVTSVDLRFSRALERGLYESLEQSGTELNLRNSAGEKDFTFIEKEYEAVSIFEGDKFRNEKLGRSATDYINALTTCREIIQNNDPKKYKEFWDRFSKPYGHRLQAIYDLYHGHYRLKFKNIENNKALKTEMDEILLQGWALKKMETIEFTYKNQKEKQGILATTLKNDSGYDLDYLDITVDLFDGNFKNIETVSAFTNDINAGDTVELYCYETVPGTAKNFVVSAVNCVKKEENNNN